MDAPTHATVSERRPLTRARYLYLCAWIASYTYSLDVVSEFKTRFFDNERFFDKYAKGKFGSYLLRRHEEGAGTVGRDQAAAKPALDLFVEDGQGLAQEAVEDHQADRVRADIDDADAAAARRRTGRVRASGSDHRSGVSEHEPRDRVAIP